MRARPLKRRARPCERGPVAQNPANHPKGHVPSHDRGQWFGHSLVLGTRTRSASATEFAIALKARSAANEPWQRAPRSPEGGDPGLDLEARARATWIPPRMPIGKTKRSCFRSVARIRAPDKRPGRPPHPGRPMQCGQVPPLPPLLRIPNWGGGSLAAPLLFERGADPILDGKRPDLICRPRWPSGPELGALVAKMGKAWARRNSDHVGPIRRGADPIPARRSTFAMVVAETVMPSLSSSPLIRG